MPSYPFLGEGSATKIYYRTKGTLILTSLLEDRITTTGITAVGIPTLSEPAVASTSQGKYAELRMA